MENEFKELKKREEKEILDGMEDRRIEERNKYIKQNKGRSAQWK